MAKNLLDGELNSWEAFASTGPYGYSDRSVVVFRCTSEPGERPRAFAISGDKSDAETLVATASRRDLLEMLGGAQPLD